MERTYELMQEQNGVALWRCSNGKWTVTGISRSQGQVYSLMPSDQPAQAGCTWFARMSDYGIDYVSGDYSESYARRMFARFTREEGQND